MISLNRMLFSLVMLALLALASPVNVCAQESAAPHDPPPVKEDHAASGTSENHVVGEATSGDHHAPAAAAGYDLKGDLPFWSGVAFLLFALVVWRLDVLNGVANALFKPVAMHEAREKETLANAARLTGEANELLKKNRGRVEALDETVRATLAEANRDAAHATSEVIKAAENEARLLANRAKAEIERVRDQTLNDIFDTLATKVAEATEQRLRSQLQTADQDRLIDETLSQLSGAGI